MQLAAKQSADAAAGVERLRALARASDLLKETATTFEPAVMELDGMYGHARARIHIEVMHTSTLAHTAVERLCALARASDLPKETGTTFAL